MDDCPDNATSFEELPKNEGLPKPASDPVFYCAAAFAAFQIWTAAYNPLTTLALRSVHVGFLLLLGLLMYGRTAGAIRSPISRIDALLALSGFALGLYHWVFQQDILLRIGNPNTMDQVVAFIIVTLLGVACKRAVGWQLLITCMIPLAWACFGENLPAPFNHRGYDFEQILNQLFMGTEGIYGTAAYVSATYIFLFILFSAFMEQSGLLTFFNDMAIGLFGRWPGGAGHVCSVSSALMGTVSGSGLANVVASAQFTIPLMKKSGFRPVFAASVEAVSSMGGQIMPPVMGAGAFIMAEMLGVPYSDVAKAAVIPALLYFASLSWMIHLEAKRHSLQGMPKEQCPGVLNALRERWFLLLPLFCLVWLIFSHFTPLFAGTMGLLFTVILILGMPIGRMLYAGWAKVLLWIAIGAASTLFFKFGVSAIFALIAALVIGNLFKPQGRMTLQRTLYSLVAGTKSAVVVGICCAIVGVIDAVFSLTGAGLMLANVVMAVSKHGLFLSLLLTMITCLVLGLGLPTVPSYMICATFAVPVLLQLGVPPLAGHMFIFYFAIMAQLTPPVALAAMAAAPFAKASPTKIGWLSTALAMSGFVVPFAAVYNPALLFLNATWIQVVWSLAKVFLVLALLGAAMQGFLIRPLNWSVRMLAVAAAIFLTTI